MQKYKKNISTKVFVSLYISFVTLARQTCCGTVRIFG